VTLSKAKAILFSSLPWSSRYEGTRTSSWATRCTSENAVKTSDRTVTGNVALSYPSLPCPSPSSHRPHVQPRTAVPGGWYDPLRGQGRDREFPFERWASADDGVSLESGPTHNVGMG
jgi:hypothetical protein